MSDSFRIVPLSTDYLADLRTGMTDCLGHRLTVSTTAGAGNPCRFSLRSIRPGERAVLLSHSPFVTDQPYREIGPIFISLDAPGRIPTFTVGRRRSIRRPVCFAPTTQRKS